MRIENPWWSEMPSQTDQMYRDMRPRAYFEPLAELVEAVDVRRAVVLMGPRRVGKTVLLQHIIQKLLDKGIPARSIAYLSLDQPLYSNLSIEELAGKVLGASLLEKAVPVFLFLDEIQYLRDWERHLKAFVDVHPHIKCVVSGSAAAALRLKSIESGAGRFTDFFLPPLTFYEYLDLQEINVPIELKKDMWTLEEGFIETLNEHFIRYIQIGGYPEIVFSETIQQDMGRYVRSDIIDKVLLRDLPSLYGIQDIQELNSLFMSLAWNTAQEVSLDKLSQNSGVTKPTLKRYLEYLEAAFLIKTVHRIDQNAKRFKRVNFFKVYLTNPSIHCALFGSSTNQEPSGALIETAVFAQLFHLKDQVLHYARWKGGEVDMVFLNERGHPDGCLEVKWSDNNIEQWQKRGPLRIFLKKHPNMHACSFTTRTKTGQFDIGNQKMMYLPTSLYCYLVGLRLAPDFSL
ncbi:ATP-binding protein [Candidatus Spongiihabitans sp.]|uniref:ATP-binding protein n=1 Tax=Candidatus Spongiihabitans sp. TaxID=3101308 RepID=UPI003C7B2F61